MNLRSTVPLRALIRTESGTVSPGANLTFTCEVVGQPLPQVQWFHDGATLGPTDKIIMTQSEFFYFYFFRVIFLNVFLIAALVPLFRLFVVFYNIYFL